MLSEEMTGRLVNEIRRFLIADAATLSKANDEQLRRRIADIVDHKLVNYRISPQERSRIVRLVFSSIRGMGILDEILADDSITEIMINGPFHIFVERAGRLEALNKKFASENELRNIIQKMVGSVGKEVNEANPIVHTIVGRFCCNLVHLIHYHRINTNGRRLPCKRGPAAAFPVGPHCDHPKVFQNSDDGRPAFEIWFHYTGSSGFSGKTGKSQV